MFLRDAVLATFTLFPLTSLSL